VENPALDIATIWQSQGKVFFTSVCLSVCFPYDIPQNTIK